MSNPFAKPFNASGSFLPEDYVARKAETRANIITLSLFALVMAGVTGAFVVTTRTWTGLRNQQQALKAEYEQEAKKIDQLKALEAKRQEILEKAEVTAALAERVPRWVLLAELTLRMPDQMRRDMLTFKGKRIVAAAPAGAAGKPAGTRSLMNNKNSKNIKTAEPAAKPKATPPQFEYQLTLAGTAQQNNDVADYIAALRESPVLRDVELQFIREAREDEQVVRKFEILAMVRSDVDSKVLAESLTALVKVREAAIAKEPAKKPSDAKKPMISPAAPLPTPAAAPVDGTQPAAPVTSMTPGDIGSRLPPVGTPPATAPATTPEAVPATPAPDQAPATPPAAEPVAPPVVDIDPAPAPAPTPEPAPEVAPASDPQTPVQPEVPAETPVTPAVEPSKPQ